MKGLSVIALLVLLLRDRLLWQEPGFDRTCSVQLRPVGVSRHYIKARTGQQFNVAHTVLIYSEPVNRANTLFKNYYGTFIGGCRGSGLMRQTSLRLHPSHKRPCKYRTLHISVVSGRAKSVLLCRLVSQFVSVLCRPCLDMSECNRQPYQPQPSNGTLQFLNPAPRARSIPKQQDVLKNTFTRSLRNALNSIQRHMISSFC